jgi:hypothetical protein
VPELGSVGLDWVGLGWIGFELGSPGFRCYPEISDAGRLHRIPKLGTPGTFVYSRLQNRLPLRVQLLELLPRS